LLGLNIPPTEKDDASFKDVINIAFFWMWNYLEMMIFVVMTLVGGS
jgi:hypothetical protein